MGDRHLAEGLKRKAYDVRVRKNACEYEGLKGFFCYDAFCRIGCKSR